MAATRCILLCAVTAFMAHKLRSVRADCSSDIANLKDTTPVTIRENSLAGTIVLPVTTDFINLHSSMTGSGGFVNVTNGSFVIETNVTLDGPQNHVACESRQTQPSWQINCNGDTTRTKEIRVFINLTDDFGPYFTDPLPETNVSENAAVGSSIIDLGTIVRDDDCTSMFNYIIDDKSKQVFKVSTNNLILDQTLDYERQTEYHINLTVLSSIENAQDSVPNSTILTVRVLDVDDMNPIFDVTQFLLPVPEAQDFSSKWFNATPPIQARDGDVGLNTKLTYSLQSVTPNLNLVINNDTGEVQVLEELDREQIPAYTVIVKAAQVDATYKTATATLSLLVADANDNRPVFIPQSTVTILENAPDGSYVTELTGYDPDEGENSLFDFIITSDSVGAFKTQIQQTTNRTVLVVRNSAALRGHAQAVVEFYLKERLPIVGPACNNNTTCFGRVTIDVTDVNDNTPLFNSSDYTFTIPSNTSGHYVIGQVFANDTDRGNNAVVKYNFTLLTGPPDCSQITLDPASGVLAIDQQLPPGATCSWFLTACDSPTDLYTRRCSSVPLTISVIPAGNVVENTVTIPENSPVGSMVKSLPIQGLHTTSTEFEIRADVLYTKVPLDREIKDRYEVPIISGQNGNSVVMIVYVNVTDVNDNPPKFGQPVYVINLDSSWKINQTVLQVSATDDDIGINAQLTFSLATGREYFDIDPATGQIRLTNFPPTNGSEYQLLATDSGQPPYSSIATLKVYRPVYDETATVLLPVSRDELLANRDEVAKKLGSILGLSVRIYNIESLGPAPGVGSKVYIGATSPQGQPIGPTELNSLLEKHANEIYDKFAQTKQASGSGTDSGLSILEIVLICVASMLMLLLLLAAFLCYRSNKKLRQSRRLFDSLNKDTTIYDNPRKPSSSAAAIASSNNNSTNAQRMLARLSSGSLGNSSVTNLLSAQGDNSEGVTPPGSNGSQRRQQSHDYDNTQLSPTSNPIISNAGDGDTSPVETNQEQITTFSSQMPDEDATTRIYPDVSRIDNESNQQSFAPPQAWPADETAFPGRRNSDVDSGTISDKETQLEDADEDDQEVATILSDPHPLTHSHEDSTEPTRNRSSLDLMTTSGQSDIHPEGFDNPGYLDTENPESNMPPEPEPDYAKKVRFSEATATIDSTEPVNSPDIDDKDASLARFLNQYGGAENLAVVADTTQDSLEEMTAL